MSEHRSSLWKGLDHLLGTRLQVASIAQAVGRADSAVPALRAQHSGPPLRPVADLLADNAELIARIKLCFGADRAAFDAELLPLIRRYAEFVHLLPATADNYFAQEGGLLRLGLEVGFYALQGTDGRVFSGRATLTERRHLEPRWRLATFIAGLCGEIHLTLGRMVVRDNRGQEWPAFLQPLTLWLSEQRSSAYAISWLLQAGEARNLGLFALRHIVSDTTLCDLAQGNVTVVPHMLASIGGLQVHHEPNVLGELVQRATALVIDRDLNARAARTGRVDPGEHVGRYLIEAMQRLAAAGGTWAPNSDRSRVWLGRDGLFLIWPNAGIDVCRHLDAEQLPGIAKLPESIVPVLVAAGVVEPRSAEQVTWTVAMPPARLLVQAIKLRSLEVLFAGQAVLPRALEENLVVGQDGHAVAARQGGSAPAQTAARPQGSDGQMSLLASPSDTSDEPQEVSTEFEPSVSGSREGIGLHPELRRTLLDILCTLDAAGGATEHGTCVTDAGIFIPLAEFARRQVVPEQAARTLSGLGMLVRQGRGLRGHTVTRSHRDKQQVGVVLLARYAQLAQATLAKSDG